MAVILLFRPLAQIRDSFLFDFLEVQRTYVCRIPISHKQMTKKIREVGVLRNFKLKSTPNDVAWSIESFLYGIPYIWYMYNTGYWFL